MCSLDIKICHRESVHKKRRGEAQRGEKCKRIQYTMERRTDSCNEVYKLFRRTLWEELREPGYNRILSLLCERNSRLIAFI